MRRLPVAVLAGLVVLAMIPSSFAAPRVEVQNGTVMVAGDGYRSRFVPESAGFDLEVQDAGGRWQPVAASTAGTTLGIFADREHSRPAADGQPGRCGMTPTRWSWASSWSWTHGEG